MCNDYYYDKLYNSYIYFINNKYDSFNKEFIDIHNLSFLVLINANNIYEPLYFKNNKASLNIVKLYDNIKENYTNLFDNYKEGIYNMEYCYNYVKLGNNIFDKDLTIDSKYYYKSIFIGLFKTLNYIRRYKHLYIYDI